MLRTLEKWGDGLALQIPAEFAKELGLEAGQEVEMSIQDGKLIIEPPRDSLSKLLAGVTDANIHAETDTGGAVGEES